MKTTLTLLSLTLLAPFLFAGSDKAHEHGHGSFKNKIGLQLWSLRDLTKEDPEVALDLVKAWGIEQVEAAGLYGWTPEEYREEIEKRGLKLRSAHVQYGAMKEDPKKVVAEMKALGVEAVFIPWIRQGDTFDIEQLNTAVAHFNKWGAMFAEEGIRFGYHPHGYEFAPGELEGETLLDSMFRKTDPETVWFEMDVFWVVHGGGDPVGLLHKYKDRWIATHIKDIRKGAPIGKPTGGAPATDKVAVGTGQIDWEAVISTALEYGVDLHFIEDEGVRPHVDIPLSLAYLKSLDVD
ncbi:sugar phosphate isomerase/epimerase [Pelagicoccus sp. NFK12]|uniref:Sugar phosphate isomerase/epimerase n=1 Tax=Pelagicoccus enzymogenes TaxID=2773457 RepID=A0A927F6Z8_9BACT|nr:sugar phosphate isomerase/epimerase [Pelagicoccus enzymogenes]MBD5778325.1 sugar phosphate isomerase/epimerase [Pelagicoccus enzymogenes]